MNFVHQESDQSQCKKSATATPKLIQLSKAASTPNAFSRETLSILPIKGLKLLKQHDLNTKLRQYIPVQYQDILCPKPPDDVMECVAKTCKELASQKRMNATANKTNEVREFQVTQINKT